MRKVENLNTKKRRNKNQIRHRDTRKDRQKVSKRQVNKIQDEPRTILNIK